MDREGYLCFNLSAMEKGGTMSDKERDKKKASYTKPELKKEGKLRDITTGGTMV